MLQRIRELKAHEGGFTLIELLIVIVILGILAAIVVFAVSGISDRGKLSACKADKESVTVASEAYLAQNPTGAAVPTFASSLKDAATPTNASLVGDGLLHDSPDFGASFPSNTLTHNGYTITYTPATGVVTSNLASC